MIEEPPSLSRRGVGTTVRTTIAGERVEAFVPEALPPEPPLEVEGLLPLIGEAHWELGRLVELEKRADGDSLAPLFSAKEAVCSSWIEGIESSVSDVLRLRAGYGADGRHPADTRETQAAAEALDHGLDRLRAGVPTSTRLLCELHGVLLSGQTRKRPGQLRPAHVWIGGPRPSLARFVPPPPDRVPDLMGDLQEFFHAESNLPPLLNAGLAHVQFETIHPYLDGNGRAGRALIALLLSEAEVLRSPLLYLSRYFLAHQWEYYDRLNAVRVSGDWEGWMRFFLQGVVETARHAVETGGRLLAQFEADRSRIRKMGRAAPSALEVLEFARQRPFLSTGDARKVLGDSRSRAAAAVARLQGIGLLAETTGSNRERVFAYERVLDILEELVSEDETEPPN